MALDSLLESLARDADAETHRLDEAARAEAARIRADAEARATTRCDEAATVRAAELQAQGDGVRARARHEAAVGVLRARNDFLDRVFAAVEASLPCALDAPGRAEALEMLVNEAIAFVPGTSVVIRCRAGLVERVRALTLTLGTARVVADPSTPEGVTVEADDGSVHIDNTLEDRLRRLRPMLSVNLLARLVPAHEPKLG